MKPRLSMFRVLAFSTLSVPIAGVGLPLAIYLAPLYANEVGLGLELTGLLFMVLRFWDIFTDPVMGVIVDRFSSPLGRVKHWILLSVPLLGLATWFIYMPPREGASPSYFATWMLVFYVGFTLLQTSRSAWVPSIAVDYDDRSRFFLMTEIVSTFSMLGLLAVPALLPLMGVHVDRFGQVAVMGWILIVSLPIAVGLALTFVPDRPIPGEASAPTRIDIKLMLGALKNRLLGRVLLIEILFGTAIAVTAANYLFVAEYVFGLDDAQSSLVLILFFVVAIIAMPFWLRLAARTEKHVALQVNVLTCAASYVIYYFGAEIGGLWALLVGAIVNGAGFSAPIVLTRSMIADVVEQQAAEHGENRSGIYYALLTGAYKIGSSLALGVGYLVVGQVAGFHPGKENSPEALHGLLLVFCLLPAALYVAAAWAARNYPLTRAMQRETAIKLDARGPAVLD